ncbi:vacuolar iron transporter 1 [Phtheirospermum japonicum]|uniref:Vacuolar iron transporter n=1 Tax=Phtheirospermum japonicum TaxID=374723 RepID=A0A830CR03_9LAMI|nr:vacuolar iron transporter 1 [Phtheirospermum japonicum]
MGDSGNNNDVPLLARLENERPKEPWKGEFVKSIVYAGLDAIVTSFSLISSISAGHLSSVDVLVLGIANLVADGISMGFGDFVSSSTERDVANRERSVTEWDVENHRRIQQQELVQRYQALGMSASDATTVVSVFANYPDILVDEKLAAEKGTLPPDQTDKPWKNGLVTFVAFLIFGSAPILAFIILIPFTDSDKIKFIGACVLSALALAFLGIAKAKVAGQNYAASAGITLFNGMIAGAAAYGIGWTLRNVAGLEE